MQSGDENKQVLSDKHRSDCVISKALDIVGDRWTLLIVRDMLIFGKKEYNEFIHSAEGISTNILANRLKMLVESGICTRRSHPFDGKKLLYELTEAGAELAPVLIELAVWSKIHTKGTFLYPEVANKIDTDKEGFCEMLIEKARSSRLKHA